MIPVDVIKFASRVEKIERKSRVARAWRDGPVPPPGVPDNREVLTSREDLGYAILLKGSTEWLFIGKDDPGWVVGDEVVVSIERTKL